MPWYGRKRKVPPAEKAEPAPPTASSGGRRRSLRTSTGTADKKSKYFDPEPEESDSDVVKKPRRKSSSSSAKTTTSTPRPSKKAKREEEDDLTAPEDSELDEDEIPKVTFEPLPQLRDTGGVEYADDRLHQNTLEFLKDLKKNNKRTWLKTNDEEFRRSLKDWESYVMTMTEKIMAADETIPELPFKDVNFRIYRDVRFSHDPTPYKPNYGAAWSRTGRKGPYACYYLHLEPGGKCFVGGGLWHPPADMIAKIRASIDQRPKHWRRVLMDPEFRDVFLSGAAPAKVKGKATSKKSAASPATTTRKKGRGRPSRKSTDAEQESEPEEDSGKSVEQILQEHEETAVIKAFAELNKESALKIRPQGYQPDHRDIELLKLRSFTVSKKIPDGIFTDEKGQEEIARIFGAMVGFVTFLNKIVMPDPGDEDDESDEE